MRNMEGDYHSQHLPIWAGMAAEYQHCSTNYSLQQEYLQQELLLCSAAQEYSMQVQGREEISMF